MWFPASVALRFAVRRDGNRARRYVSAVCGDAAIAAADPGRERRAIALTTAKRFPLLSDIPTIAEAGYSGFEPLA
jgi:hypothetical protein